MKAKEVFISLLSGTPYEFYIDKLIEIKPFGMSSYIAECIVEKENGCLHFIIDIREKRIIEVFETDFLYD